MVYPILSIAAVQKQAAPTSECASIADEPDHPHEQCTPTANYTVIALLHC